MTTFAITRHPLVCALIVLILLGRIFGLHAHSHVELDEHHHDHGEVSKIHLASVVEEDMDFSPQNIQEQHSDLDFEIEQNAIVKFKFKSGNQLELVWFCLGLMLFVSLFVRLLLGVFPRNRLILYIDEPIYLKFHALRAPPR
ncbi:MAG: hypothetical protein OEZ43_17955 [Gammaproteobacteria bacterium]|nr:hypothetical protein [Gammaproteobacteria bacterium]